MYYPYFVGMGISLALDVVVESRLLVASTDVDEIESREAEC